MAFNAFSCHEFEDSSWLKADLDIECGTPEHEEVIRVSWVAIVAYPCFLLLFNLTLLVKARKAIQSRIATRLSRSIAFLHREYEPSFYFWEVAMRSGV